MMYFRMISWRKSRRNVVEKCQGSQSSVSEMQNRLLETQLCVIGKGCKTEHSSWDFVTHFYTSASLCLTQPAPDHIGTAYTNYQRINGLLTLWLKWTPLEVFNTRWINYFISLVLQNNAFCLKLPRVTPRLCSEYAAATLLEAAHVPVLTCHLPYELRGYPQCATKHLKAPHSYLSVKSPGQRRLKNPAR